MRLFISSVIDGFAAQRAAAKAAVESLGHHAVMAEAFGARPYSSKVACLAGVRECDCYLGIFAERYGWVASSGKSVTHEEFEEARRLGKPILLIVQNPVTGREPALAGFLAEVGQYEAGYFYGSYTTQTDLVTAITRAVTELARSERSILDPSGAARRLQAFLAGGRAQPAGPTLLMAATPADPVAPLDIRLLGRAEFQTRLSRAARSEATVFRDSLGTQISEGADSLSLAQEARGTVINRLEVHADRAVAFRVGLEDREEGHAPQRWLERMIIDETRAAVTIEGCLRLIAQIHTALLPAPAPPRIYVQAALSGTDTKRFGRRPTQPLQGISLGGRVANPLIVPPEPMLVPLAKASEAADLADQLREHFARAFKVGNAYFTESART